MSSYVAVCLTVARFQVVESTSSYGTHCTGHCTIGPRTAHPRSRCVISKTPARCRPKLEPVRNLFGLNPHGLESVIRLQRAGVPFVSAT